MFLAFTALSFVTLVKPNWLMPVWVTGTLLAAMLVDRRVVWANLGLSAVLHAALAVELVAYPFRLETDDTWYGWSELSAQAQVLADARPDHFIFADDGYKTSAELGFYMKRKTYSGNVLGNKGLQYDYIGDDLTALNGRNGLFFDSQPRDFSDRSWVGFSPPAKLSERFDSVQELDPILIRNSFGNIVRKFRVFDCRGFHYRPKRVENAEAGGVTAGHPETLKLPGLGKVVISLPEDSGSERTKSDAGM